MRRFITICFFLGAFYTLPAEAASHNIGTIQMAIDAVRKIVKDAPAFLEKWDLLRGLNDIEKLYIKPAEGMQNTAGFLSELLTGDPTSFSDAFRKVFARTEEQYRKAIADEIPMNENLRKTPPSDPGRPSKVAKFEGIHKVIPLKRAELEALGIARSEGVTSAIQFTEYRTTVLLEGAERALKELQATSEYQNIPRGKPLPASSNPLKFFTMGDAGDAGDADDIADYRRWAKGLIPPDHRIRAPLWRSLNIVPEPPKITLPLERPIISPTTGMTIGKIVTRVVWIAGVATFAYDVYAYDGSVLKKFMYAGNNMTYIPFTPDFSPLTNFILQGPEAYLKQKELASIMERRNALASCVGEWDANKASVERWNIRGFFVTCEPSSFLGIDTTRSIRNEADADAMRREIEDLEKKYAKAMERALPSTPKARPADERWDPFRGMNPNQ